MFHGQRNSFFSILAISVILTQLFAGVYRTRAQSSRVWSDPVNISNSGSAVDPVIVVGRDGVIHAIWSPAAGGFRYARSEDGISWTPPRMVSFPFLDPASAKVLRPKDGQKFPFRLIPSPDGVINIFWINADGNLMLGRANSEQLPVPSSWASKERVADDVLNFDVDITTAGVFHLAYIRNDEKAGIYYQRSPNGALWTHTAKLYSSQYIDSMTFDDAHVRVSAPDDPESRTVLVAWDVRSIKRIFMATSTDSGSTFSEALQIKGPEDTGGYGTPFNIELGIAGEKVLMVWQVGEPGATQCTFYSQSSNDGGQNWTNPLTMMDARSLCPERMKFLIQENDFLMAMLYYQGGNPAIVVWNGSAWGAPQVQSELSSFTNPLTFDTLQIGCENETLAGNRLYLAGCDQGLGGDIWITSRPLEPREQWLGSSSAWSYPNVLVLEPRSIAHVTQLAEHDRIHAVWFQASLSDAGVSSNSIYYSQLENGQWSVPREMIGGLIGRPTGLSMAVNEQGTMYVVWSDEQTGALLYAAANSERAEVSSEWTEPLGVPVSTGINSSPDVLVDASGRVMIAYAVPFNEGRGIYVAEANGRELVWSTPVQVFDAAGAQWDVVNDPEISLTPDGTLHMLFSRYAPQADAAVGLYYSRSTDGGATWTLLELVREGSIIWSEIVSDNKSILHRFWQEDHSGIVSNFDQASRDGGTTWDTPVEITSVSDYIRPVALAVDGKGDLHFLRLVEADSPSFVKGYDLVLEDWMWNGGGWDNQESQKISISGERAQFFISGALTANGLLSVLVAAEYIDLERQLQSQVVYVNRKVEVNDPGVETHPAAISKPAIDVNPQASEVANTQPNVTPQGPVMAPSSPVQLNWNLAGFLLVLTVLALGAIYGRRRSRRHS